MSTRFAWILPALFVVGCAGNDSFTLVPAATATLAGGGPAGAADGPVATASFHNPVNVAVDADGTIFVSDFDNGLVRKISTAGIVSTLVNQAGFARPFGIVVSPTGALFVQTDANDAGVASGANGTLWRINKNTGVATKIAGSLGRPRGLGVLSNGDIVLSDLAHDTIRRINPVTGVITDIAGMADAPGFVNDTGNKARFDRPYGVVVLPGDVILVADQNNNCIRRVTLDGVVSTYAGTGTAGMLNGPRLSATFNGPQDIAVDASGRLFVADTTGHVIRMINRDTVTTFAGDGIRGYKEGPGTAAEFFGLEGLDVAPNGSIVVADGTGGEDSDPEYNRVRIIHP